MVTKRRIFSKAPTRIDLAGGTIDIWPIYLFLKNPLTINLGINLFAEAELLLSQSEQAAGILLRSEDQNTELALPWESLTSEQGVQVPPALDLHFRLLKYFYLKDRQKGLTQKYSNLHLQLSTRARSPAGAGLGGSSTLSIAIIGALAPWVKSPRLEDLSSNHCLVPETDGENFIEIVRDVETTVIRVPAGLQDYYGAMFGGLQRLNWGAGIHERSSFAEGLLEEVENRTLLYYSGQSRNSGINNWILFKGFIDQQGPVRSQFEQIGQATHDLSQALETKQWTEVGKAISKEWDVRKTLASGITTPQIDQAFELARKITPVSGKVCGAGGGGCFFIYLPTENKNDLQNLRESINRTLQDQGIRPLPFKGVKRGLEVEVTRA